MAEDVGEGPGQKQCSSRSAATVQGESWRREDAPDSATFWPPVSGSPGQKQEQVKEQGKDSSLMNSR